MGVQYEQGDITASQKQPSQSFYQQFPESTSNFKSRSDHHTIHAKTNFFTFAFTFFTFACLSSYNTAADSVSRIY